MYTYGQAPGKYHAKSRHPRAAHDMVRYFAAAAAAAAADGWGAKYGRK